jgi:putative transposase
MGRYVMTAASSEAVNGVAPEAGDEVVQLLAVQLVAEARRQAAQLVGPAGLLTTLTKHVLETALQAEMEEHLECHGRNARNGFSAKTVLTNVGEVRIRVPRDRAGTFEPAVIPKYARRLSTFDGAVLSLYAKGMTTGDISRHLEEVYGCSVSRELVSEVTDTALAGLHLWQSRRLQPFYPVVSVYPVTLKVRDGRVVRRNFYLVIGVSVTGECDVLGIWAHPAGLDSKDHARLVFSELLSRGVQRIGLVCFDGPGGITEGASQVFPNAGVHSCVPRLVRMSMQCGLGKDRASILRGLALVVGADSSADAEVRFGQFLATWRTRYPVFVKMCERAWPELQACYRLPAEGRRMIYSAVQIDDLNLRLRQAVRRRSHFPNDQAALKVLYLAIQESSGAGPRMAPVRAPAPVRASA